MSGSVNRTISPLQARMIEDMTARKLSPKTQTAHIRSCRRFAAWLGRSPETATADDVRGFQHELAQCDISNSTRNTIMTGVKFLLRVTLRRHDLVAEIYHLREPQKIPPIMSQDEVARLLANTTSIKARAMLSLAYGCGLRPGEVIRLRVGDIDTDRGIIRVVQSKGDKDRQVKLPTTVLNLLRDYWGERSTEYDAEFRPEQRYLFPGRSPYRPLTTRQQNRLFHQAADAAGITKPVTVRSLRHSFATHLLDAGVDVRVIQALLGHVKLTTTARYTRVATALITAIESPIDLLPRRTFKPRKRKKAKSKT
ncbi:MAG: tyrosine-type recombinase/integrase [Albidovulum sp.]|uniref:tyrosine-type recombinase/integrase n=1 Tax=Albidovulum sp. TaxID=1872424 RepID=UPI003CA9616E